MPTTSPPLSGGRVPSIPRRLCTRDWEAFLGKKNLQKQAHAAELIAAVVRDAGKVFKCPADLDEGRAAQLVSTNEQWNNNPSGFRRAPEYSKGWDRLGLWSRIVRQLLSEKRPVNDDDIKLGNGNGGALPKSGVRTENMAFIVTGPPAAGKSTIARPLAEQTSSVIIDPDDVKRMLPEYRAGLNAASLHDESVRVTRGPHGVLECAVEQGMNIVLPTLGSDHEKLLELQRQLRGLGYLPHLVLVDCAIEVATVRALRRLVKTQRYVPLEVLLLGTMNRPRSAFARVRQDDGWAGVAAFDSSEAHGTKPAKLYQQGVDLSFL